MAANNPFILNAGLDRDGSMSQQRQFAWLERSTSYVFVCNAPKRSAMFLMLVCYRWPALDPTEWQARKVLGMGSTGLVGLWDYIGNDATKPRHMAVKQVAPDEHRSMRAESKFLHLLASTGTKHVVRLYKEAHALAGTGTMDDQDPLPFDDAGDFDEDLQVNRMYLEYVPGGDMADWIDSVTAQIGQPPEEHLWRILLCMAKALHVLEYGTEDPAARDMTWSKQQDSQHLAFVVNIS